MIKLDRCGFCKHSFNNPTGTVQACEAFPKGEPRGFEEKAGRECSNGYYFSLKESEKELYEKVKHMWEY